MAVSVPAAVDFSVVVQVAAPAVPVAVAVLPATQLPPLTAPKAIVAGPPAATASPVHWSVLPATATAPEAELTQPTPAVIRGAVQPAGTTMLTAPPEMPPVAAV